MHDQESIYRPPTIQADLSNKPRLQQDYAQYLETTRAASDTYPGYYHRYYDCNSYVDYEIGRVIDAVRSHLSGDTYIIYSSDHGDHLGAFGLNPKGPTMYDQTTAVPLIVTGQEIEKRGCRVEDLITSVDIPATILDLAGVEFPADPGYVGRSLRPLLRGASQNERHAVFLEYNRFGLGGLGADGFYPIRCVRTQEWKLSINLFDTDELYNLHEDPHEARNLIDDPSSAAVRNHLHNLIVDHMAQTRDTFYSPQWGQRPWRPDYRHQFQGYTTTGLKDAWEFGRLDD